MARSGRNEIATVITIPLTTLTPGTPITVPATAIPTGLTQFSLQINRNVGATPVEGIAANQVAFSYSAEFSLDGGANWSPPVGGPTMGGMGTDKFGNVIHTTGVSGGIPGDPTSAQRQVRATVTPVVTSTVSGTLTLS